MEVLGREREMMSVLRQSGWPGGGGRSTRGGWVFGLGCWVVLGMAGVGGAQEITVQQPVVEMFGISTSVLVPDSGGAFLGGVGTAAMGRRSGGFGLSGVGIGQEMTGRSMSAHVWIQDLHAMDEALLAETEDEGVVPRKLPENKNAAAAWKQLQMRHAELAAAGSGSAKPVRTARRASGEFRLGKVGGQEKKTGVKPTGKKVLNAAAAIKPQSDPSSEAVGVELSGSGPRDSRKSK